MTQPSKTFNFKFNSEKSAMHGLEKIHLQDVQKLDEVAMISPDVSTYWMRRQGGLFVAFVACLFTHQTA
eukprot:scaffold249313_cov74-Cyclotella_meneghiniana.AAC.5